jgi:hypothetical protein
MKSRIIKRRNSKNHSEMQESSEILRDFKRSEQLEKNLKQLKITSTAMWKTLMTVKKNKKKPR